MELHTAKQILNHWNQHDFPGRVKTAEVKKAQEVIDQDQQKKAEDHAQYMKQVEKDLRIRNKEMEANNKKRDAALSRCAEYIKRIEEHTNNLKAEKLLSKEDYTYLRNSNLKQLRFWKNKYKQISAGKFICY